MKSNFSCTVDDGQIKWEKETKKKTLLICFICTVDVIIAEQLMFVFGYLTWELWCFKSVIPWGAIVHMDMVAVCTKNTLPCVLCFLIFSFMPFAMRCFFLIMRIDRRFLQL